MSGSPVLTIARFSFLEALRNRLVWLVAAFLLAGFGLTEFIGEVTITESREFQSGFLGAVLRVFAVLMVGLFVITSMVRELNDKGLELVLSLPIPRSHYLLGKLLGFSCLAVLTAIMCSACLALYAPAAQVLLWGVSLCFELLIVTALSVLCLFTFSHVTPAMSVVMAFYLLSRTIAAFQLIGRGTLVDQGSPSQRLINHFVDALAYVLPDLHRFTSSEWLMYQTASWETLLPIVGQSLIYVALLSAAALFDLYRKNL